jgi:hypothetical protein
MGMRKFLECSLLAFSCPLNFQLTDLMIGGVSLLFKELSMEKAW